MGSCLGEELVLESGSTPYEGHSWYDCAAAVGMAAAMFGLAVQAMLKAVLTLAARRL